MIEKPPHGRPCNGCGLCCEEEVCVLGRHVLRRAIGPCPALVKGPEGASCGLVTAPETYAPVISAIAGRDAASRAAAVLVGAGIGCDSQLDGEPSNEGFRAFMRRWRNSNRDLINNACNVWGL